MVSYTNTAILPKIIPIAKHRAETGMRAVASEGTGTGEKDGVRETREKEPTECVGQPCVCPENHSEFKPTTQNHRFVQETHPADDKSCIINLRRGLSAGVGLFLLSGQEPSRHVTGLWVWNPAGRSLQLGIIGGEFCFVCLPLNLGI